MMLELGPEDVGYASMPLFHTNSLMSGLAPALVSGASLSLARRFSASRFLPDVRHYGATWFNYTGKLLTYLLATPAAGGRRRQPPARRLRQRGVAAGRRGRRGAFRCPDHRRLRLDGGRHRPGPNGEPSPRVDRASATRHHGRRRGGNEVPRAEFDGEGRLVNADRCVGEMVNTLGVGPFEGYYRNEEAMRHTTRQGWYWSGDLGYVDDDGWVYFAGRTSDWLRVDGENFTAAPIEAIVGRHPDVMLVSAYGVPAPDSGDQVMVALVLRDGAAFDAAAFAAWLDAQADLSPKWQPRFVRVCEALPSTPTNKILTRTLAHEKFRSDRVHGDAVYVRARDEEHFRLFGEEDEASLRESFVSHGRRASWDL